MAIGDFVPGPKHGVLVDGTFRPARTKRGARRLWLEVHEWLPWEAEPGRETVVRRIEKRRVVEEWRLPPRGDPGAGVREPRRPRPAAGGAAVTLDPPPS